MDIDVFGSILKKNGIESGSGVPCSFFTPLVDYMGADPGLNYCPAASEGEAVAIAAGMTTAGKPAFALMQNSGLGNAVNPITSMLYIYQMPVTLLVSHRGEPGKHDEPQHVRMGVITEELVKLCGIECHVFDPEKFESTLPDVLSREVPAGWVVRKGTLSGGPVAPPIELEVTTSAFDPPPRRTLRPEVTREDALRALLPILNRNEAAVVSTTGKQSRELYELDDKDPTKADRVYMVGSMGCASGFGLGIAEAQPKRKVLVLDGDGALLMKMGTMATVGWRQPKNFHHVVIDNAAHESTGGQATASPAIDIAAIALACGYKRVATVSNPLEFAKTVETHLASEGPTLVRMLTTTGARDDLGRPKLAPRDNYLRFKKFLSE